MCIIDEFRFEFHFFSNLKKWPSSRKKWLRVSSFPPAQKSRRRQMRTTTPMNCNYNMLNINIKLNTYLDWILLSDLKTVLFTSQNQFEPVMWSLDGTTLNIYRVQLKCSIILLGKQFSNKVLFLEWGLRIEAFPGSDWNTDSNPFEWLTRIMKLFGSTPVESSVYSNQGRACKDIWYV